MRFVSTALFLLFSAPAQAETPMSPSAFEAYSQGRTLYYLDGDQAYGAEQYLPGRRVIWTFLDGECETGYWYEETGHICFLYDARPNDPQCWSFFRTDRGITARFRGDPDGAPLVGVLKNSDPLICQGPKVGV